MFNQRCFNSMDFPHFISYSFAYSSAIRRFHLGIMVCFWCDQAVCVCACAICNEIFELVGWRSRESVCLKPEHATVCMSCTEYQVWSKDFYAPVKCFACKSHNSYLERCFNPPLQIFCHGDRVDNHYKQIRRSITTQQNPFHVPFDQKIDGDYYMIVWH